MNTIEAKNAIHSGEDRQRERDINFDMLKVIGLFCVIIAHTDPPEAIFYFQSFDVPLMVIISGALFSYSSRNRVKAAWTYIKQRLLRLIVPTWTFLVFFFSATYVVFLAADKKYPFSTQQIVDNFALLHGYVWVIRVFVLMAIITPWLLRLRTSLSERHFFLILMTAYVSYEIIYRLFGNQNNTGVFALVSLGVFYIVPYGCLFGLGMSLPRLEKRTIGAIILLFLGVFSALASYNYYSDLPLRLQQYKYPPRLFYISYAIFVSLSLYLLVERRKIDNKFMIDAITFISSSSLWIYLWHIFFIYYWNVFIYHFIPAAGNFLITFVAVLLLSMIAAYLQKRLVTKLILETQVGKKYAYALTMQFIK
jgi:hypothetical protein